MGTKALITTFEKSITSLNFEGMMKFPCEVRKCQDWNEEKFVISYGPKFMDIYKNRFKEYPCQHPELFFSLLMNDWCDPRPLQNYKILTRIQQYEAAITKCSAKNEGSEKTPLLSPVSNTNGTENHQSRSSSSPDEVIEMGALPSTSHSNVNTNTINGSSQNEGRHVNCFYEELRRMFELSNKKYDDVCLRIFCHILADLESSLPPEGDDVRLREEKKYKTLLKKIMNKMSALKAGKLKENTLKMLIGYIGRYKNLKVLDGLEDSAFKNLCQCLMENKLMTFREELTKFIEKAKTEAGDYYHIVIHFDILILSMLAFRLNFDQTFNFILQEFPYVGLNSSYLEILNRGLQFRKYKAFELEDKKLEDLHSRILSKDKRQNALEKLQKMLENIDNKHISIDSELYLLVFGQPIIGVGKTVYEIILSQSGTAALIKLINEKFKLSENPEILSHENSQGKVLLDFVIESKSDENLLFFLYPQNKSEVFLDGKLYIKFLDSQYRKKATKITKNLIEKYIQICYGDESLGDSFFRVIFSLLEEIGTIQSLFDDASVEFLFKTLSRPNDDPGNTFDDSFVVLLLAHLIAYSSPKTKDLYRFEVELMPHVKGKESYFRLLLAMAKDNTKEDIFKAQFLDAMKSVQNFYEPSDLMTNVFAWIFVLLALKRGESKRFVIDHVFKFTNFANLNFELPPNMKNTENTQYFAKVYLENGNDMGKRRIPPSWITPSVFSEFLDSRVSLKNNSTVLVIDCNFLLDQEFKCTRIWHEKKVDDRLIFWEGTKALEYIEGDKSLKNVIDHPAIATYIDLKMHKFLGIQLWELLTLFVIIAFIFGGLIHKILWVVFAALVVLMIRRAFINFLLRKLCSDFWFWFRLLFIAICFLIWVIPESLVSLDLVLIAFTFYFLLKSAFLFEKKFASVKFFNAYTNLLLVLCIIVHLVCCFAIVTSFIMLALKFESMKMQNIAIGRGFAAIWLMANFVEFWANSKTISWKNRFENLLVETLALILAIYPHHQNFETLCSGYIALIFPISAFLLIFTLHSTIAPFYFMMFRLVWITFFKTAMAFSVMFLSFAALFRVIFSNIKSDENFFKNFSDEISAILKVLLMATGEFSVDVFELNWAYIIIFLLFVATSIVALNLIMGLALDDVQTIRQESRRLNLVSNVKFIIAASKFYTENYHWLLNLKRKLTFVEKRRQCLLSFPITSYPFLHKIDKIYINIATKKMTVMIGGKHRNVATTRNLYEHCVHKVLGFLAFEDFKINKHSFDYCMKLKKMMLDKD